MRGPCWYDVIKGVWGLKGRGGVILSNRINLIVTRIRYIAGHYWSIWLETHKCMQPQLRPRAPDSQFWGPNFAAAATPLCDVSKISLEPLPPPRTQILDPHLSRNGSFPPNNLLPTVRSDCKKLGAAPIASNSLKPVRLDSREQIYLKITWCEWSLTQSPKFWITTVSFYKLVSMTCCTFRDQNSEWRPFQVPNKEVTWIAQWRIQDCHEEGGGTNMKYKSSILWLV